MTKKELLLTAENSIPVAAYSEAVKYLVFRELLTAESF